MVLGRKYSITSPGHILGFQTATIDRGCLKDACNILPDFCSAMDLRLIQFLSECRDEEHEAIDRWLSHAFQPVSTTMAGVISVARGMTRLAEFLGTTESAARHAWSVIIWWMKVDNLIVVCWATSRVVNCGSSRRINHYSLPIHWTLGCRPEFLWWSFAIDLEWPRVGSIGYPAFTGGCLTKILEWCWDKPTPLLVMIFRAKKFKKWWNNGLKMSAGCQKEICVIFLAWWKNSLWIEK